MQLDQVCTWVVENFKLGDVRRARALAELVWGLLSAPSISFAAIGRSMESRAKPASDIKRAFRFCHNENVDPHAVHAALVAQVAARANFFVCGRRLVTLAVDWHVYDNGRIQGLRVCLVTGSRALPLLWYEVERSALKGRRTAIELQAVQDLIDMRPEGVTWLLLLDSGFRAPAVIQALDKAGYYVVRSQSANLFHSAASCWTAVGNLPVAVGHIVEFGWGHFTRRIPLEVRVVGARIYDVKPGKPGRRRPRRSCKHTRPGLCIVATNLPADEFPATVVIRLYARRFEIEHGFRDLTNATYGMDMEHVHLEEPATYDRLMCIVAIAEALLWIAGTEADLLDLSRDLTPSRPRDGRRVLSLRTVGRYCFRLIKRKIVTLLREHLADAIAGVINVIGYGWVDGWRNERLDGATLARPALPPLPFHCSVGVQQRARPCLPLPNVVRVAPSAKLLYLATRAGQHKCVHA